jgi:hypothetical protein
MSENRRRILQMLAAGKISIDEAERLIAATEKASAAAADEPARRGARPKYMHVVVDTDEGRSGDKPTKVNIRVPMQLLRAGVRLSSLIPEHARDKVNQAMREQGVAFDLNQLKPENLEELIEQLSDLSVNVDKERTKVRIFCE